MNLLEKHLDSRGGPYNDNDNDNDNGFIPIKGP